MAEGHEAHEAHDVDHACGLLVKHRRGRAEPSGQVDQTSKESVRRVVRACRESPRSVCGNYGVELATALTYHRLQLRHPVVLFGWG